MKKNANSKRNANFVKYTLPILIAILLLLFGRNQGPHLTDFEWSKTLCMSLYLPSIQGELITHSTFKLDYAEPHEQAFWVAYTLEQEDKVKGAKRKNYFKRDKKISTGSASGDDYKKSGYDRGHLVPAADRSANQTAMDETFYMSNIAPQDPQFNRGIWKELEDDLRQLTSQYAFLFIITGGVLDRQNGTIRESGITIPTHFYKIAVVFHKGKLKAESYLIPNAKQTQDPEAFLTSIDAIETLTTIDFFAALPDTIEDKLEASQGAVL